MMTIPHSLPFMQLCAMVATTLIFDSLTGKVRLQNLSRTGPFVCPTFAKKFCKKSVDSGLFSPQLPQIQQVTCPHIAVDSEWTNA
jgi:hypothetical protein